MKKIVSVLLCLVMMMSLCTVAFANATDYEYCNCENQTGAQELIDNGNGTHYNACATCHKRFTWSTDMKHGFIWKSKDMTGDPDYVNGEYCNCGAKKSDQKPECKHDVATNYKWVSNGNGTHKVICKCADVVVNEAEKCVYEKGVCKFCKDTCNHMANKWVFESNGDGTHDVICEVCGEHVSKNVACNYENGKCITCGAEKPVCNHVGTHQTQVDNKDGKTHNAVCDACGEVASANIPHTYQYDGTIYVGEDKGTNCICGAEKPVCDHVGVQKVVDNKDGKTHTVICPKCNEVLYTDVAHVYAEDTGKCACGAVKPAECKHEGAQKLVPNKDKKTHNAYCPECGELMSEKIPHTYQYNKKGEFVGKGGSYCLCGAKKSTSSAGSNTGSTTTNTTTKSPKTGDMGVVLYAATALLSLSGTAVVIKKRKNDK